MAMYENEGSCPSNAFLWYLCEIPEDERELREAINKVLGSRTGYMVYDRRDMAWGRSWPSIVKVLYGEKKTKKLDGLDSSLLLAWDVAQHLKRIIPICRYGEEGKKILIHDVLSPQQISDDICYIGGDGFFIPKWGFSRNGYCSTNEPLTTKGNKALFSDDRYLVVIVDKEDLVEIYILETRKDRDADDAEDVEETDDINNVEDVDDAANDDQEKRDRPF